jgi:hypothetical protein
VGVQHDFRAGLPQLRLRSITLGMDPIEECLEQPDHRLFTHRGCHIFATEILNRFPTENYSIRTIEIDDGYGAATSGFHILPYRSGFVVDAHGIKREQDYCMWLCGKRSVADSKMPVPLVRTVEVESGDLLVTAGYGGHGAPLNKWGHLVHPDFLRIVGERARKYIESIPERFQVSLLIAGFELRCVPVSATGV